MKETERPRRIVQVAFDLGFLLEIRKILFRQGISLNEFFSYVIQALVTGDQKAHDLLSEAIQARTKKEISDIVHTDDESLYNIIEERLRSTKKE